VCNLGSPAQLGTKNIGLKKDILADGANLELPEPEGSAPIETPALHDGAATTRKTWRKKEGNGVHQARRKEGANDPAAALDEKRLHPALGEGTQKGWDKDAAGTVSRQEKNLGPGPAQGPFAAQPRAGVACALAWLRADDERRGRAELPDEPG
jgi:hypothetical protein